VGRGALQIEPSPASQQQQHQQQEEPLPQQEAAHKPAGLMGQSAADIAHHHGAQWHKCRHCNGRLHRVRMMAVKVYRSLYYQLFVVFFVLCDLIFTVVATGLALTYCGCSEHARPKLVARIEEALGIEAVVVASIFIAEQLFKLGALGLRRALLHLLDWLDLVVVVCSFVLSVTLLILARNGVEIAGLLTLLRLWRLFKIAQGTSGLVHVTKELQHARHKQDSNHGNDGSGVVVVAQQQQGGGTVVSCGDVRPEVSAGAAGQDGPTGQAEHGEQGKHAVGMDGVG